jgi:peroxiredoxin
MARWQIGQNVGRRLLEDASGAPVALPRPQGLTHLQLRRFAGCPVCHLHLASFARRHGELQAAGVHEVVVFHTAADELRRHGAHLPFTLVPDPGRVLYAAFGVGRGAAALLHPRAWWAILRAVAAAPIGVLRGRPLPPWAPAGGRLGLPADFLLAPDGRLVACRYGRHADDQWSVDEVLALARQLGGEAAAFRADATQPAA